jgi:hypothetical protein
MYHIVIMKPLTTNGLITSSDFPITPYEAVHSKVVKKWSAHPLYDHYAGSWNALAYRFQAATNAGTILNQSLRDFGASPPPLERYRQEHELFSFFSCGFSAFEAAFYAAFTLGAFLTPSAFPLTTPKDQQRISPNLTIDAYQRTFVNDPILDVFNVLVMDSAYQQWREVRNVLTHRTAPGRRVYVSIGDDAAPNVEWKLNNIQLDEKLVPNRQRELSRLVSDLVSGLDAFLIERI